MSRVSARDARPPSSSTTYGHLLLASNDTTTTPAHCQGARTTPPQRATGAQPAFPSDSPRRQGSRGEPSTASLPGMGRELLPGGGEHGRHSSPSGAVAEEWGREEQRLLPARRFTSASSSRACGSSSHRAARAGPARPGLAGSPLTSAPAHAQAHLAARPPPHIAVGRGGSAPVTARLPMAGAASPDRPAPGLQGGAAGWLREGRGGSVKVGPSRPDRPPPGSCVGCPGFPRE